MIQSVKTGSRADGSHAINKNSASSMSSSMGSRISEIEIDDAWRGKNLEVKSWMLIKSIVEGFIMRLIRRAGSESSLKVIENKLWRIIAD